MNEARRTYCFDCGTGLNEPTVSGVERSPCPECGSLSRRIVCEITEEVGVRESVLAHQVAQVGTATEDNTALPVTVVKAPPSTARVSFRTAATGKVVDDQRLTVDRERLEGGALMLSRPSGINRDVFFIGDDPDDAALAIADEFLDDLDTPPDSTP